MKKIILVALSFLMFACSEEEDSCTPTPILTTNEVSNITDTSVVFSGTIEAPTCDPSVTSQGFVYGVKTLPEITDEVIKVDGTTLSKEIIGLKQNQTYYYRTYFTNPTGNYYGEVISFKTSNIALNPIYLDTNGITVKARDWAGIGAKGVINDVEYTLVNNEIFKQMMTNGDDVSTVCTTRIKDMNSLFYGDEYFNQDISSWDVSNVTDMNNMLYGTWRFNQDISAWDVSKVMNLNSMFYDASSFNQDLNAWDVSNVTDMTTMFSEASSFNQNLNAWDVSNVTTMRSMFSDATAFNQNLNAWDVSNVTDMTRIFSDASSFNQNLNAWDVGNVKNMEYMFYNLQNFNQNINAWDVSNVTTMRSMFSDATAFNQDLSAWDVSNVTNMSSMFYNATSFNQDLSTWDVGNVVSRNGFDTETPSWTLPKPSSVYLDANGITVKAKDGAQIGSMGTINGVEYTVVDINTLMNRIRYGQDVTQVCTSRVEYMGELFRYASSFNQDISAWDVSNVTNMGYMFYDAQNFNQDISVWDVSNVTTMEYMFYDAQSFNQDLSAWDVSNVTTMEYMFYDAQSFNQDLSAWDVSNVQGYLGFDSNAYQWTLPRPNFISPFYIGANGVTVKVKEGTPIGAKGLLNGVEYTVVDYQILRNMINNGEDVTKVCTSRIEDMGYMFYEAQNFNQDISAWDVSNVISMNRMFLYAYNFNQNLSAWDVSNVTTMEYMFYDAQSFNQDLSAWDVSNVQGYLGFDSNTYQWRLPRPNFNDEGVGTGSSSPTDAPVAPTAPEADVLSIFSDAYTDLAGSDFDPDWGQETDATIETYAGNEVLQYKDLNYQGLHYAESDVSGYTKLHLDYWTADATTINVSLISVGPLENAVAFDVVTGSWQSVDINLSEYPFPNLTEVFQLKTDGDGTVIFDNIYFY